MNEPQILVFPSRVDAEPTVFQERFPLPFMAIKFLHTADLQIGKPFASLEDASKRERLRQQRLATVQSLASMIEDEALDFVVVCGDLFDSATPDKTTVSALCSALGSLKVPVYAIPGNHDHGGPGCIWQQAFFLREQEQLAPNLKVLLEPEPLVTEDYVILPCPLQRRHVSGDPSAWLRSAPEGLPDDRPRIVLAHGSTQGFSSKGEEDSSEGINQIELGLLPEGAYDYIALGDWHGMKQVGQRAWFSGTPEQDRYGKGENNQPGHVLTVEIESRGAMPSVQATKTSAIGWHTLLGVQVDGDAGLDELESTLQGAMGTRAGQDLVKLQVEGSLSLAGFARFESMMESLRARSLDLRLSAELEAEPSQEELDALTRRDDPIISAVALELARESGAEDAEVAGNARSALRELHLLVAKGEAQS